MSGTKKPSELNEETLDQISGGPEYLAPGVYVEEVSLRSGSTTTTRRAGLRSDGELVQAVSEKV